MTYHGLLHKYGHLLDIPSHTRAISLLEGNTPLVRADNLSRQLDGGFELFIKYEGLNPSGSFKDRGMTAAVSEALGRGATTVMRLDRQHGGIGRSLRLTGGNESSPSSCSRGNECLPPGETNVSLVIDS